MAHGRLDQGYWIKVEKAKDKLRMGGGSWSINLEELPEEAHTIVYVVDGTLYCIERGDALAHGFERVLGGERKLVVPEKYWKVGSK